MVPYGERNIDASEATIAEAHRMGRADLLLGHAPQAKPGTGTRLVRALAHARGDDGRYLAARGRVVAWTVDLEE